jgi:hypothetical protein
MVAVIGNSAQERHDTLQERDIRGFSTLKLLCQDRHARHHLLDNSMFRLQHFNRRRPAHLISLTIATEWYLPDIHPGSCSNRLIPPAIAPLDGFVKTTP